MDSCGGPRLPDARVLLPPRRRLPGGSYGWMVPCCSFCRVYAEFKILTVCCTKMFCLLILPLLGCIRLLLLSLMVPIHVRFYWGWGSRPGVSCVVVVVVCRTIAMVIEGVGRVGVIGDGPALSDGQTAYSFLPFADVVGIFCV